jgi:ribonuclease HI
MDVWSSSERGSEHNQKVSAKVIKHLTMVQRVGALAITGGLHSLPTDMLDASAYLMPAELTVDSWCHRALVQLAMLPEDHLLHKTVVSKRASKIKRHKSPANFLLERYGYNTKRFKKIPAITRNPMQSSKLPFKTKIAKSRDASMRNATNAKEEVQVYADGSAMNRKVGVAAILIRAGKLLRMLHMHLGPESKHTVHEAELVGMLLGMHLISTENHSNIAFALGVDNQAAIKAFHTNHRNPGQHIAREIQRVAEKVQKRRNKAKYSLTIRWMVGHEGIEGNEKADREAKKAAEGMSSDRKLLPVYLRKPLPTNPAAVKRAYQDMLKRKWAIKWRRSPRGRRAGQIEESTPLKKLLISISQSELSREAASQIAQLRIGHAPFNQYLKHIGRVDSNRCPACRADTETTKHYLLLCPAYAYER